MKANIVLLPGDGIGPEVVTQAVRVLDVIAGKEHERGADFIIVYHAEVISGDLIPADDADAAEWFSRDNLPPLAFIATQKVLGKI